MEKYVVIVAGGVGSRMNADIPKQFIVLKDKPILMHTILRFYEYDQAINIVVVLPKEQLLMWQDLCKKYNFTTTHQIAIGGENRFQSVKNGLDLVPSQGVVAIHDGVRPLVSLTVIGQCFNVAQKEGNAIPSIDMIESVRKIAGNRSEHMDRSMLRIIQTPQVFQSSAIHKAYQQPYDPLFTDDASVLEKAGFAIHLVEGNKENIKITTPSDLLIASLFI